MSKTMLFFSLISFIAVFIVMSQSRGRAASDDNYYIYLPVISVSIPNSLVNTFYISPDGNDSYSGKSKAGAWATFNRAWQDLYPGDTLILLDGVYYQTLNPNVRNGEPGKPITIRAKNDGKAVIDGQYQRTPVRIGDTWNHGYIGEYFVIEGIVAQNSKSSVYVIRGDHNIMRRISGYNANTDQNNHVIDIWANDNLIEDCVASGTGRKMIMSYKSDHNTIRRCFADWESWDGREWHDCWPWGDNFQIYNGNYNTAENIIAYGSVPVWSISIQANDETQTAVGNKILGSIAINAGMNPDGTIKEWGDTRPQPSAYTCVRDFNWPIQRVGFLLFGRGELRDNLFQDILSWGNAGLGLSYYTPDQHPNNRNNIVQYATVYNNGLDNPYRFGGISTDMLYEDLLKFDSIEDTFIENIFADYYPDGTRNLTTLSGPGARLSTRYVDGMLTSEPLWPWPMEDRIQSELGISVTDMIVPILDISK